MKTDVEHIIAILEKIDDFPESLIILWSIIVGEDNMHHLLYGNVISEVKRVMQNPIGQWNGSIIDELKVIMMKIDSTLSNENLRRYVGNRAFKRELNSLVHLKSKVSHAISDLNRTPPTFDWIY